MPRHRETYDTGTAFRFYLKQRKYKTYYMPCVREKKAFDIVGTVISLQS